jgi:GGDEF domain-containing protein
MSTIDEATEFLNAKGLRDTLDRELDRAKRSGGTGVLLIVGIDLVNAANKRQDQDPIDPKLLAVADVLRSAVRKSDSVASNDDSTFSSCSSRTRVGRSANGEPRHWSAS